MPALLPQVLATIVVFWGACGLAVGSFLSVVISRVPAGEGIGGRSRCPRCHAPLTPLQLVPVASYLFLGGKCRRCGKGISWLYPLLEVSTAVLFLVALSLSDFHPLTTLTLSAALATLLAIAVTDATTQFIPDVLNGAFIAFAFLAALSGGHLSFVAPLIAASFFFLQWALSRGKWVGSGDVLLSLGMGVLLGDWRRVVIALLIAYILGAAVAVVLLLRRRVTQDSHVAFGPFLALGTLAALLVPAAAVTFFLPL